MKPPKRPFYYQRFAVFIALIFPSFAVFLYISILKIPKPGFFKVDGDSSILCIYGDDSFIFFKCFSTKIEVLISLLVVHFCVPKEGGELLVESVLPGLKIP